MPLYARLTTSPKPLASLPLSPQTRTACCRCCAAAPCRALRWPWASGGRSPACWHQSMAASSPLGPFRQIGCQVCSAAPGALGVHPDDGVWVCRTEGCLAAVGCWRDELRTRGLRTCLPVRVRSCSPWLAPDHKLHPATALFLSPMVPFPWLACSTWAAHPAAAEQFVWAEGAGA